MPFQYIFTICFPSLFMYSHRVFNLPHAFVSTLSLYFFLSVFLPRPQQEKVCCPLLAFVVALCSFHDSEIARRQCDTKHVKRKPFRAADIGSSVKSSAPTIMRPQFESQAHHLRFFQFVLWKFKWKKDENKQKEAGIGPFKKANPFGRLKRFTIGSDRLIQY